MTGNPQGELQVGEVHAQTLFAPTAAGRISCENSPDRSEAPLLWIGGSAHSNVFRFRSDIPESIASKIEALLRMEAPQQSRECSCPSCNLNAKRG